ncbi:VOC family protein [Saccharopolyspora cebuensis]|uniref:VOC family protein n=1 Tax=Saccharopolyspora cebuensis TaxID=418759 RepID=A0ABV4CJQ4_9PSEU
MAELDIDRTIYPMPMFATFAVADLAVAETFYHALGFLSLATVPDADGTTAVVHLRRLKYQDVLLVPGQPVRGSTTVSFAAHGEDLARLAREIRAVAPPTARVEGPVDTPWFTSDLRVEDPDGNLVVLTAQREAEQQAAQEWARSFGGEFAER